MQPDLFHVPKPKNCGTCVVWNGGRDADEGTCSVHGHRSRDAASCDRWFATDQLNAALYGRKGAK